MNLRPLLGPALFASVLSSASLASASPGTVTLSTGEVLSGEIQQVVKGEYVLVQMPSGEVKAIAWTSVGRISIGGAITLGGGSPPPAQPAPTYAPPPPSAQPAPPPAYAPPPTYTQPAPPPAYAPAPASPASSMYTTRRPAFEPGFTFGVRVGSLVPGGQLAQEASTNTKVDMSQYVKAGGALEGRFGLRFSPSWTLYGFWEWGQLTRANAQLTDTPTTNALGMGLHARTAPFDPVGFVFDAAIGYRWLNTSAFTQVPDGAGGATTRLESVAFDGVMPLRLGAGVSLSMTRKFRLEVLGQLAFGTFTRQIGGTGCENGCDIAEGDQTGHTFVGLTAGAHWDL